jgi:hypothetical protein
MSQLTPYTLTGLWRDRAQLFRAHGAHAQAATLEGVAAELDHSLYATEHEPLTLAAAADESGYSISQLRRMIREGTLPNAGNVGAPRVVRMNLPRKPGFAVDGPVQHDISSRRQIARAVAAGR